MNTTEYKDRIGNIVNAGIKAMIAENTGFDPSRIILLEGSFCKGLPTWIAFEVAGQGYTWDIESGRFAINNAYGDRLYGEDE